jgi:hypothetical protein
MKNMTTGNGNGKSLVKLASAVLLALEGDTVPSSHLWMAIERSMEKAGQVEFDVYDYMQVVAALAKGGLVNNAFHLLSLTPLGLEVLARMMVKIKAAEAKVEEAHKAMAQAAAQGTHGKN